MPKKSIFLTYHQRNIPPQRRRGGAGCDRPGFDILTLSRDPWHGIVGEGEYGITMYIFYLYNNTPPQSKPQVWIVLPRDFQDSPPKLVHIFEQWLHIREF
jgi:hypothetical protein